MPSFNRLFALTVLGVAMLSSAAPVAESSDSLAVGATDDTLETFVDLDARDDEDVIMYEDDSDDVDVDSDDVDAAVERRAAKTKAKTTKAKATKAATTKAKTTKAATTKAKTTKAAATTKAPKTGGALGASKAPKSAKASKTKAVKSAKASKTHSAKASSTSAASCAYTPKAKTPKRDAYNAFLNFFRRDGQEFVGWHGTNSKTAEFWKSQGQLAKPPMPYGAFDFLFGPKSAGTSGADAEIGLGVYITDEQVTAAGFASKNALENKGTTPVVCAIFAKSQGNWRNVVRKAFMPESVVGDSKDKAEAAKKENARLEYIKKVVPGVTPQDVVKFAQLDRTKEQTAQMVIPASITSQFTAVCVAPKDTATVPGTDNYPQFSYRGAALRSDWKIVAENDSEC